MQPFTFVLELGGADMFPLAELGDGRAIDDLPP
jgi:hypothetical protein